MRAGLLLALLAVFAPLSFASIGGGQSAVSEIHRQVVSVHGWMSEATFVQLFALSRLAPGPGSLLVTSVAIFLPTSLLLYGLARVWQRHKGAAWQRAIERGLQPVAAGLILSASFTILQASRGGALAWLVAGGSTAVLATSRVSPFLLLGAGAAAFLLVGL